MWRSSSDRRTWFKSSWSVVMSAFQCRCGYEFGSQVGDRPRQVRACSARGNAQDLRGRRCVEVEKHPKGQHLTLTLWEPMNCLEQIYVNVGRRRVDRLKFLTCSMQPLEFSMVPTPGRHIGIEGRLHNPRARLRMRPHSAPASPRPGKGFCDKVFCKWEVAGAGKDGAEAIVTRRLVKGRELVARVAHTIPTLKPAETLTGVIRRRSLWVPRTPPTP